MKKLFSLENPIMVFMGKVFDTAVLNLLWTLTSLPIVTLGASTAALNDVTNRLIANQCGSIAGAYWRAFRTNFKPATHLYFRLFVPAVLLAGDIWWLSTRQQIITESVATILTIAAGAALMLIIMTAAYALPAQTIFANNTMGYITNSFKLAMLHLPKSILVAAFNLICLALTLGSFIYLPPLAMLPVLFGTAFVTRINLICILPVLKPFMLDNNTQS